MNMLLITVFDINGLPIDHLTVPVDINVGDLAYYARKAIGEIVKDWDWAWVFFSDNTTTTSIGKLRND